LTKPLLVVLQPLIFFEMLHEEHHSLRIVFVLFEEVLRLLFPLLHHVLSFDRLSKLSFGCRLRHNYFFDNLYLLSISYLY
jgi:hypothetical protein